MANLDRDSWLRKIAASGLEVLEDPPPGNVPSVLDAWQRVASMETRPVATIRQDHPDALSEVNRQWFLHASENGLFTDDGSFLISVAGRGSSTFGWARVRWSEGCALAERLQDEGSPEYVGMSLDGRGMCAVTTEEYDYWIVVHRFE